MAFWGVRVTPSDPHSLFCRNRRLRLTQAILGHRADYNRSFRVEDEVILICRTESRAFPVRLCLFNPAVGVEMCRLDLEFKETEEVIFSVVGNRVVHLAGYFVHSDNSGGGGSTSRGNVNNNNGVMAAMDDESEDITMTDGEGSSDDDFLASSDDDYDLSDPFINDGDPKM